MIEFGRLFVWSCFCEKLFFILNIGKEFLEALNVLLFYGEKKGYVLDSRRGDDF